MKQIAVPLLLALVMTLPLLAIHVIARADADPITNDCSYSKPNPGARS